MSFKKNSLDVKAAESIDQQLCKRAVRCKRKETRSLQGWKMALGDALTQEELWHVFHYFLFLFLAWFEA